MVRRTRRLIVTFVSMVPVMFTSSRALTNEPCTITGVRIAHGAEWRIAPGEPVTVALEVDAACGAGDWAASGSETAIRHAVGRELSQRVELDGTAFRNRLSEGMLNDIAQFEVALRQMGTGVSKQPDSGTRPFTVSFVVRSFVNAQDRRFVFDRPGVHTLKFYGSDTATATVSVIVDVPTSQERPIFEALKPDGVVLCLASFDDCSKYTPENLAALVDLLSRARGTRYERYLSVVVGVGSLCQLQKGWTDQLETELRMDPTMRADRRAYDEGIVHHAPYFKHTADADITSEFDVAGLWHLASIKLLEAKGASTPSAPDPYLNEFMRLCERIAASPIVSTQWSARVDQCARLAAKTRASFDAGSSGTKNHTPAPE